METTEKTAAPKAAGAAKEAKEVQTVAQYATDLLALHTELSGMDFIKGSKGSTGNREYKYQDLPSLMAQLNPVLHKYNFIWRSKPGISPDGQPSLQYALIHISGVVDAGEMLLQAKGITPQDQGGAITYARRYAISAQLGIVSDEDDDAAKAQKAVQDANKTLSKSKETDIYTMLERIGVNVEDYEGRLQSQYNVDSVTKLTNVQADEQIAQMAAYIQRKRVEVSSAKS